MKSSNVITTGIKFFAALIACLGLTAGMINQAWAQSDKYPSKPVRIVVGYSPGTTSDVFARIIAQRLSDKWGQSVIVENRDGAAGSIGADVVAKSAPDGYTLMLTSNAFTLGPALRAQLPYDPFKDFSRSRRLRRRPTFS